MKEKIIITGSSGFLGVHLIKKLKDNDCEIYAFTSSPQKLQEEVKYTNLNIVDNKDLDQARISKIFEDAIVINCAFPRASSHQQIASGLEFINSIFRKSVDNKAKCIINISSQSLYPSKRIKPASEDSDLELTSLYEIGKFMVEQNLEAYCYNTSVKFTNVRLASLIGPGFNQRIVNKLVEEALKNHKITVEDNQKYYGYLDIEDAVTALEKMVFSSCNSWRKVYNLGPERGVSLKEIGVTIQHILLEEAKIPVDLEKRDSDEVLNSTLNSDAFRSDFDFYQPFKTLDESIKKIYQAQLRNLK